MENVKGNGKHGHQREEVGVKAAASRAAERWGERDKEREVLTRTGRFEGGGGDLDGCIKLIPSRRRREEDREEGEAERASMGAVFCFL